jgi:hypothetical protein
MLQLMSEVERLDRDAVLRHLDARRPALPGDAESYGRALRHALLTNVLRAYAPATVEAPQATPDEAPAMWLRVANRLLRAAGAGYSLEIDPDDDTGQLSVVDDAHDGTRTEYGAFLAAQGGGHDDADVDWPRLVTVLSDLHFLESLHYKVTRLSVVSDPALYPFWIVGRRMLRRLRPIRPEVAIHYRFLQSLTPRREARLYRALTPRWEVRRDRAAGIRRWRGVRAAAP